MTSNFTIVSIDRELPSGCCTTVHWMVSKTQGEHRASRCGSTDLPHKDPVAQDFVPYDQLAEAQIIAWVQDVLGEDQVFALEAGLDAQLAALANPVHASGVPWA